jgi:hypothetical protein
MSDSAAAAAASQGAMETSTGRRFGSAAYEIDMPLNDMAKRFRLLVHTENISQLAALKRLDPEQPDKAAFFQMLALCVPARYLGPRNWLADSVRRFAAIATIMALRPDGLRGWGLGGEMAKVGVSDQRLSALLTARGRTFRDLARRLARRLARDGEALPYLDLGRLILFDSIPQHDDAAEDVRIGIARDYQRALRRLSVASGDES